MESPRTVARAAVRGRLAIEAIDLFMADGFDSVTLSEVASVSGVSRSTMLRYFGSKEEVVLAVLDSVGPDIAKEIARSPAAAEDWDVLRSAVQSLTMIEPSTTADMNAAKALVAFIYGTPELHRSLIAKYASWVPELELALTERGADAFTSRVRAAAALDCLRIATEEWVSDQRDVAEDGSDLRALIDRAFLAVAGRP